MPCGTTCCWRRRNAAQLEDIPQSVVRFERLQKLGPMESAARIEFAGVLYRDDRLAEAIATLRVGEQTTKELLFLASLYSSEKEFATAAEVCREALVAAPDDLPALRALADNSYWGHDWPAAAEAYRSVLKRTPQDAKVTELLAEVLLSEREFDQSLKLYSTLLARVPERTDLWNGFLIAAAKVTVMDAIRTQQLEEIYRQRARYDDVGFLANLLNAVDKHGSPRQALALLEVLVTREAARCRAAVAIGRCVARGAAIPIGRRALPLAAGQRDACRHVGSARLARRTSHEQLHAHAAGKECEEPVSRCESAYGMRNTA